MVIIKTTYAKGKTVFRTDSFTDDIWFAREKNEITSIFEFKYFFNQIVDNLPEKNKSAILL